MSVAQLFTIEPEAIEFTCYGKPQPQGSKSAFYIKKIKRAVVTDSNKKLKPWRQELSGVAIEAMQKAKMKAPFSRDAAVRVRVQFFFEKPKSARKSIIHKTTKPDVDKLLRGVFDALTGVVIVDDSQVMEVIASKVFGIPERAEVKVELY